MVAGLTYSWNFPVRDGFESFPALDEDGCPFGNCSDAFLTTLSADGGGVVASTLLGSSGHDNAEDVSLTAGGDAWVAGFTSWSDFPATAGS